MKACFVQCLNATSEGTLASVCAGLWTQSGAKPSKCLLIRPSMLFPHSCSGLFHSTTNYFNPVIAQRAPGLTVHRDSWCWETRVLGNVDTSAATGSSSACLLPRISAALASVSSAGLIGPKIRRQGNVYAHVSSPLEESGTLGLWWIK